MPETFIVMLAEDGKKNSLGRVNDVINDTLASPARLEELYLAMFAADAWVRMRAADAFEKICRVHPEWIIAYIDRIQAELGASQQASIQWHIAQIYCEVELSDLQMKRALSWLETTLKTDKVDWIVAANSMKTLAHFHENGNISTSLFVELITTQTHHQSQTVRKKAEKALLSVT
ncbi:MAG: hypothetical protein WBP22_00955 [Candidatus Saccharimonas sp.]